MRADRAEPMGRLRSAGTAPKRDALRLSESEIFGQLGRRGWQTELLLGRFSRHELERTLDRSGILPRIRELGYRAPEMTLSRDEGADVLKLAAPGSSEPLVDLRLAEELRVLPEWARPHVGDAPLSLLVVHWVSLQHPRGRFPSDRRPFPGQKFPGLGLGRRLYRLLWRWARELGKEGLSAYPLYYHNAVYYSAGFAYLDPKEQGRFRAMTRDLSGAALRVASERIRDGDLLDETGALVDWSPGEMFASVAPRLSEYFKSPFYREQRAHWTEASSFRLRW